MDNLIKSTQKQWQSAKKYAANRCRHTLPEVAKQLDSCQMFTGNENLADLVALMFTPQGREFMLANSFPNLATFRKYKPYQPERYGVFIDCGKITLNDPGKVIVIGNTTAEIYCRQTQNNTVILMHGATAKIYAGGYSVTRIEKDRKSTAEVSASNTAKIL